MTQRSGLRTVPGNRSPLMKAFRALASRELSAPRRRDALGFSSDFQERPEVAAGLSGRTIQDDTSLRSSHSRPGKARCQASSSSCGSVMTMEGRDRRAFHRTHSSPFSCASSLAKFMSAGGAANRPGQQHRPWAPARLRPERSGPAMHQWAT